MVSSSVCVTVVSVVTVVSSSVCVSVVSVVIVVSSGDCGVCGDCCSYSV